MSLQRFLVVLTVLFFTFSATYATSVVDVRLSHNSLDKDNQTLYVNIDVRVDNGDRMILAGQNYRIYYPSEMLSLNEQGSKSQLSSQKYSKIQFSNVLENVEALGEGAISFDDNLGFANFSVELLDNQRGGSALSDHDGWVTIATLKFDVLADFSEVSMVWGREGMSESYATAFVEIAEWEAPQKTSSVVIDEYIDFNLAVNELSLEGIDYEITVGPNPTIDFVEIKSDKALNSEMTVSIRDMGGKLVKTVRLNRGSAVYNIDVSTLLSSSYILDLSDDRGLGLISKKIVITQ